MALSSGCTSTKFRIIHVPVESSTPCIFEKFTESELKETPESAKRRIRRNQKGCAILYQENSDILLKHNQLHSN